MGSDLVAIVASAGGITALEEVLGRLPGDLDASVLVLLHLTPEHPSLLARVLGRRSGLPVREAADGDLLEAGTVFVAPPDAHLLVTADGTLRLETSALVHYVRPSADVLLISIAKEHEGRCLAIVLSGTGIDGAAGAAAVHVAGGHVLAQDAGSSQYFGMPGAAIAAGGVDEILPLEEIGTAVVEWVGNAA